MTKTFRFSVAMLAVALLAAPLTAQAAAQVGAPAPALTLTDSNGATHSLSDFAGKYVVLEWINFDCPFVQKHYGSGNMQALQKDYTAKGVVWLAINSSAVGNQGHFGNDVINARGTELGAAYSAYLVDADGTVGHAYGAKTTPHMFVIDPDGNVIYAGGIDDRPSTDVEDIEGATNYVRDALDAAMAGEAVAVSSSQPYGCNVKYAK
jgi:peroxiredoxin